MSVGINDGSNYIFTTRVDEIVYTIVSNKLVTYKELLTYNMNEFLDIYEMTIVNISNKYISLEKGKDGNRR